MGCSAAGEKNAKRGEKPGNSFLVGPLGYGCSKLPRRVGGENAAEEAFCLNMPILCHRLKIKHVSTTI